MSAGLLEQAIALPQAGKQSKADILDVRGPIVAALAAQCLFGMGKTPSHAQPIQAPAKAFSENHALVRPTI